MNSFHEWNKTQPQVAILNNKIEMAEAIIVGDGALITGLKNEVAELRLDLRLSRLAHEQTVARLGNCETALAERDAKLNKTENDLRESLIRRDDLLAKLTEAERKLAEIYATEPVAYIGRLPFEMLKHRSLATTLTKHPAFKDDVRLIPLPQEPT